MTVSPDAARSAASQYRAMRAALESLDDTVPGKFEITKEGIVHDLLSPGRPHELTAGLVSRRLEKAAPEGAGRTRDGPTSRTSPRESSGTPTSW